MSIASEITRLQNAKASIKTAIENKGVTVPSSTTLSGYDTLITSIPSGLEEVSTSAGMEQKKTSANIGNYYKYTGTSTSDYTNGNLYQLEKVGEIPIVSWSSGTDSEIMAMIEADRNGYLDLTDYWNVGDTRTVTLSSIATSGTVGSESWSVGESHTSQTIQLVLMDTTCTGITFTTTTASGRTTPRFIVGQKDNLNEEGYMFPTSDNTGGWSSSPRRNWCNVGYYNALPSTIKPIFKQFTWQQGNGGTTTTGLNTTNDYFGIAPEKAVFGSITYSQADEGALYSQWNWYQTQANRCKKTNGSNSKWWECSNYSSVKQTNCGVSASGNVDCWDVTVTCGLAPFGCI